LSNTCSTNLAVQVSISIVVIRTLRHTVEIIEIGSYTFGAVGSNNRTGRTDSRTGTTGNLITHEVGSIEATAHAGGSIVEREGYGTLLNA